ncbi:ABC transporter substrate-binding protein [Clostridium sp. HMP27]|uniref:ABC transporter substrate-binding protein n=1 Tax=Clostridium sp. HMP27 TaxID=1487921 RepID=UPI00052BF0A1|nr:ABC transporter substrate-binding protein [Clostridium sp. HMP27]KGK87246.1 amino acid ABC transporter substrate-binding protein [Clostridium sp. HMP27]
MKARKILSLVLSMVVAGAIFAGCGKTEEKKAANALESVKTQKKLRIGLEDTYPPLEFRDSKNELVGFDIDLSKEIAKKLGVEADFILTEFGGLTMALNAGKFDVGISAISITEKRAKEVDFSEPYVKGGQVIVVKKGTTDIKSVNDLKGKVVGTQLGTTGEEAAKKVEGIKEIKTYDKATQPFHDLEIGRLSAVVVDEFVGRYYLSKEKDKFEVAVVLDQEPIGIAFKKGEKELQEAVQKAVNELKADGTMSKLSEKWFGEDIYK